VGYIAVQVAGVVRDDVLGRVLVLGVKGERLIGEIFAVAHPDPVIFRRVFVIDFQKRLTVETVERAAIGVETVEDRHPVEEILQGLGRVV
jgi:hypothetical protein